MKFFEDKVVQEKLTKARYVQTGLATISLVCLYLLFLEYQNKNKTNDSEIIGYITQKTKMIQRKSDSTVVWSDVEQKTPLSRRDTIRSEELSNAVIVLNDGTELRVDENSMVILDFSDKDITINLVQGNIRAERKKTDPASTLNILSEGTKIALTDGDLSLAKKEGEAVKLISNRGTATMETSNGKKYELDQNQELVKKKGNAEYSLQTQSFNLVSPPDQAFIQSDGSTNIDFSWTGGEANLEISRDSNFQNKVFSKNSAGTLSKTLSFASYYWRVVGKKSSSVVRKFIVLQSETLSLVSPSENQSFEYLESAPLVNFSWTNSNFEASYTLEVSADPSFLNLLKQLNTKYNDLNESFEKEGTYFSRVKIEYKNRDLKSKYTNIRKFQIKKSEKISNIDLYSPSEGKNFSNSDEIFFTWKQIPEAIGYEFEISSNANFSEIKSQKKTNSNFTEISLPNGKYFWRVKPIFKKSFVSKFSNVQSFSVSDNKTAVLSLLSPNGTISESVNFLWDYNGSNAAYLFEVSEEPSLKKLNLREILRTKSYKAKLNMGNYFWRISILGQDGKEIQKSAIQSFNVEKDKIEKVEEKKEEEPNYTGPEPIFPLSGESIKSSEGRMKFLWAKKVQETFYRINIFESNSRQLLSSLETTGSGVEFDISKFKTRTELAWQMEVYYRDKQTGNQEKQESRLLQFRIIPSIAPPKIIDPQDIYYLEDKKPKP